MKKLFSGFYSPTEEQIKASWSNTKTLFIFDTNVLLNLYTYTKNTREDFFKILEKVSDNIWLPYHVGLEYQRRRLNVIKNEKKVFQDIEKYLTSIEKNISNGEFNKLKLKQRLPDLFNKSEELHSKIKDLLTIYRDDVKKWNKEQPDVRSSDSIRKKIDELFDDKVGNPFEQENLNKIFKEGEERYNKKIPPGFEDKKEKEKADNFTYKRLDYIPMYGDLIIWKQIIEKAKDEDIESVVFVTDDVKEDWWYILDSNGKKEIGVRAELREEIYRESSISSFELLTSTSFMKNGKEFLALEEIKEASIAEAKNTAKNRKEEYQEKIQRRLIDIDKLNYDAIKQAEQSQQALRNMSGLGILNKSNIMSDELRKQVEQNQQALRNMSGLGIFNTIADELKK